MTSIVTIQVRLRPHGEAISLDGQTFTDPVQLWDHLHHRGASVAKAKPAVRHSTFLSAEALAAIQEWEREHPVSRQEAQESGLRSTSKLTVEELGL